MGPTHIRVVLVCVLGLIAALPAHADDPCANWDDKMDDFVFDPVRDQIRQAKKERAPVSNVDQSIGWHTAISTVNGYVGDLTSFQLVDFPASTVCQTSDDTNSNITIAMNVGFANLGLSFDNFLLRIPLLPNIGDTKTTVTNSGNAVSVSVSVLTTPTSTCDVQLNYFQIRDLGTFSVHFESGFWNKIYQGLFNVSSRLVKWGLGKFGVLSQLEDRIESNVYALAKEQNSQICDIIHNVFG